MVYCDRPPVTDPDFVTDPPLNYGKLKILNEFSV